MKQVQSFFNTYPLHTFSPSQVVIEGGAKPEGLYFLETGAVRMVVTNKEGIEVTLNVLKAPALFPMPWIMNDQKDDYTYQAVDPVALRIAPKEEALHFLKMNPEVIWDLLSRIYRGLPGLMERFVQQSVGDAASKIITQLLILARRFGSSSPEGIQIDLKLTHAQLASESGVSRETVTRELGVLTKKGLLQKKGDTLIVSNIKALEALL